MSDQPLPPRPADDDSSLIERCRAGDASAWGLLVARYQRLVYAIVMRMGLDEHAAADVFQAVFEKLMKHLPGLREPDRLQLVGLRAVDPTQRIRGGSHLVHAGTSQSQGYVTSTCRSVDPGGWIALALLAGGRARHGESLLATNPVFDEHTPVIVVSPHMFDPENSRARA